jgi:hypothetical protein
MKSTTVEMEAARTVQTPPGKLNLEKVKSLAPDLRSGREFPRSPRATLAGYVIAARTLDKCRAVIAGWEGEYHYNCPLDQRWLKFAQIDAAEYKSFIASGATDEEAATWISKHAKQSSRQEIIAWNNQQRDLRLSDLPLETQEYLEDYIRTFVPRGRIVYHWFDVYDLEEKRI